MQITVQEQVFEEAHQLKVMAIQLWGDRSKNVFELGAVLHNIKQSYEIDERNGTYESIKRYGFDSFNQLLSAPIPSGGLDIPIASASRALRLFRKYCLELSIHKDVISKFNYSKLDQISSVVKLSNLERWLSVIGDVAPADLARLVAAEKEDRQEDEEEDHSITTAIRPETAKDWLESIDMLFTTMKETFVTPNERHFVKELCEDFWQYFQTTIERKARASEFKKPTDKLLSAMTYIVKS